MRFGFTFIIILFQRTESFIRDLHKQKGIEHSAKQMKDSKDILTVREVTFGQRRIINR